MPRLHVVLESMGEVERAPVMGQSSSMLDEDIQYRCIGSLPFLQQVLHPGPVSKSKRHTVSRMDFKGTISGFTLGP